MRRRAGHGLAIIALTAAAGFIALGLPRQVGDNVLPVHAQPATIQVDQGPFGFIVDMPVSFDSQHIVQRGEFALGQRTWPAAFTPTVSDDPGLPVLPMLAHAGQTLDVRARRFAPSCAQTSSETPVLRLITTIETGAILPVRFTVANPASYRSAVRAWCRVPVHATRLLTSRGHDGRATVTLQLASTRDTPVRVTSAAMRIGHTRWQPASTVLRPGTPAKLVVRATGFHPGDPTPWSRGLLTANGDPISLDESP